MKFLISILIIIGITLFIYSIGPTLFYKITKRNPPKNTNDKNSILLTFDDGPSKEYTNKLLDLLKTYNIQATFFVIARQAEKQPEIIKRIVRDGHTLGLHSLEHKNVLIKGYLYTKHDFEESIRTIRKLGYDVTYYRPPWGHVNLFTLYYIKKYGLKLVLWNTTVGDWAKNISAYDIKNSLLNKTKDRSVICLHDGRGSEGEPIRTIEALYTVIPELIDKEFKFKDIKEFY
jgi:peptidoglycan/xylan/chitin deacetylase (PgdA/CDA1 family)